MKPTKMQPMLAKDNVDNPFGLKGMLLQQKYDGTRVHAIRRGNSVWLMSGREWKTDFAPNFPEIVRDILTHIPSKDYVLDGELTFFKKGTGRSEFLTASAKGKTRDGYEARLMVFDIRHYDGKDLTPLPLTERLKILNRVVSNGAHIKKVATVKTPGTYKDVYKKILKDKGEGVVLKQKDSPYVPNSREFWVKVKKENTADCVIAGMSHGTGKRASTFGALILAQYDKNGKLIPVGKCSGFDHEMEISLYRKLMGMPASPNYLGKVSNIKKIVAPKLVIEVKFMERTKNLQLRFPRFVRVRTDKLAKQCRIQ